MLLYHIYDGVPSHEGASRPQWLGLTPTERVLTYAHQTIGFLSDCIFKARHESKSCLP